MAKTKISEFSTTAGNNTDINSINIAEGCAPSGINDAIRELMRQLKEFQTGGAGDSVNSGGDFSVATNKFTVASASGNTAVAGTLAVTGVATLTAQPILSSLTASKAVFTDASKGLVSNDVTGTGNVVMSNSPTLVTPALGTPASGVVTNLTGTASININGTVGATTPSTGAFTTLSSTGNTTLGDASGDTITVNGTTTFVNANPTLSAGTANGVLYLNGSKVATSGSALTFDGTTLATTGTMSANGEFQTSGGRLAMYRAAGASYIDWASGQDLVWRTVTSMGGSGAAEAMRLTSTGLGIGTSSPGTPLDVVSNSSALGIRIRARTGDDYGFLQFTNNAGSTEYAAISGSSGTLAFYTGASSSERARIDSSGNLLVGTTSSAGTSGSGIKSLPAVNGANSPQLAIVTSASTNSTASLSLYSTGAAAYRFYVTDGGTVYATSTSISAISDATLKENVRDLETGLTEVMALRPRRFDWKNGDAQDVAGFVAQEVEQVLPELVTDYQYSEGVTKKSLKMGDILPTLVNAIKEQQAIIEDMKTRLAAAGIA